MKFVSIDGVEIEKLGHTELVTHLAENTFFKFMDSGRQGMVNAAGDAIDNFSAWIMHRGPFGRGKLRKDIPLPEYFALRRQAQILLVDGLILGGMEGVRTAVSKIYLITLDTVIESNKEKA
jgi:hypothetical protein